MQVQRRPRTLLSKRMARLARGVWLIGLASGVIGMSVAGARDLLDCPLRDQPYSIDSPLMDVLLKADAKAVLDREAPELLKGLPVQMGTTPPNFAAILSLRHMQTLQHLSEDTMARISRGLAALTVTDADREARCARYDNNRPQLPVLPSRRPHVLLFEKMTGYRDGPSVEAAHAALLKMAKRQGWPLVATKDGGAISPSVLKQFDVIVWNNVSGDVLTLTEREALKHFVEDGGGFVAFHGSGGDPIYFWDWYVDTLIGARFLGHPLSPQFQEARIKVEDSGPVGRGLAPGWQMTDEWYSFKSSPRARGAHIIATLDESTYSPVGMGLDLHMGADHPIAWSQCIGKGRSFYSAIGHRPETYTDPHYATMLQQAVAWAAQAGHTACQ